MKTRRYLFALVLFFLYPAHAWAVDGEFYTYGGFDAVVSGFQRIALIFSDNAYKTLFFSVIVLGMVLGAINLIIRVSTGSRVSPVGWLVPIFIGTLIYLGMVIPTGRMNIYSTKTNKFQQVPGVPNGVIMVAHVLNSIEKGLIEIIETSTDPKSYTNQAGGVGYMGILKAASNTITPPDPYLGQNLYAYLDQCVGFEVDSRFSPLTVEELRRGSANLMTSLEKAANPALPVVFYNSANPKGATGNCKGLWTNHIKPALNATSTTFGDPLDGICSEIGYDPSVAASQQKCRTSIKDVLGDLGVTSMTSLDFIRQAYLAQRLSDVFRSGNTAAVTNYKFMLNSGGTMVAANEWLPVMKGVMTSIALALVPILALFLPTPLMGKALSFFLGMMIWLTSWGVIDAMLHSFAIDFAGKILADIPRMATNSGALGMDAFYFMPKETVKVLAMFGTIRMSGLMLATVMTGLLVKFGGHALASMAGNLTGQIQAAGTQAARVTEDPSGRAAALNANNSAMPTQTIANAPRWGYSGMTHAAMKQQYDRLGDGEAFAQKNRHLQQSGDLPQGNVWSPDVGGEAAKRDKLTGAYTDDKGNTKQFTAGQGGDGTETMQTPLADGWTLKSSKRREDGTVISGTDTYVSAAGTITETFGGDGKPTAHIQASGMSNNFGHAYQEVGMEKGAHTLSTGKNWNRLMQEVDKDSTTSGEARAFKQAVSEKVASSVQQKVEDGFAYQSVSGETKQNLLEAGTRVGLSGGKLLQALTLGMVTIEGGVGGKASLTTKNGESVSVNMSESEVSALNNEIASMRESALTETMQTSAGRDYAKSSSAQDNGAEGFSYLREASVRNTTSTGFTTELMTGFVNDRAAERMQDEPGKYQDMNAARRAVLDDINRKRLGTGEEQNALNRDIKAWTMRNYDAYWDAPKDGNHVVRDIAHTRNLVSAGVQEHRTAGEAAAGRAETAVADNTFKDPRPGNMPAPDVPGVVGKRAARKQAIQDVKNDISGRKPDSGKGAGNEDEDVTP